MTTAMTAACVKRYALQIDSNGCIIGDTDHADDPGVQIDKRTKAYATEHGVSYAQALEKILADHPDLFAEYSRGPRPIPSRDIGPNPAAEAHRATLELLDRQPGLGYSNAAARVLRESPILNQQYGRFVSGRKAR